MTVLALLAPIPLPAADVDVTAAERVAPALPEIPARSFLLTDFGAVPDGRTLNTSAFRAAIAAVAKAGGGRLVVPTGVFRTQPFELCSNLELSLDPGAVIQAPDSFQAYGVPDPSTARSQAELDAAAPPAPLISGRHLHDVAITGAGAIDGEGALWWAWSERAARAQPGRRVIRRPNLVVIEGCARLRVTGITLRNSPKFHLVPRRITDLTIDGVVVRAPADAPNTDAIDPGPVTNAVVRHCDLDTGDDDIVIKSGGTNILIEDCTIRHGHGISIGSETTVGIHTMLVRRCTFEGTDNGIRIKSMRGAGGLVENVRYTDIQMKNVGDAIVLDLTYVDNNRPNFRGEAGRIPVIRDILIDHVSIVGAKRAGRIIGLPESRITGVTLRDVTVAAAKDFVLQDTDPPVLERVTTVIAPVEKK